MNRREILAALVVCLLTAWIGLPGPLGGMIGVSNVGAKPALEATHMSVPQTMALEQDCSKLALELPKVLQKTLIYPGRRIPPRFQTLAVRVRFTGLPAECGHVVRRRSQMRALLQSPTNRRKWYRAQIFPLWTPLYYSGNKAGMGGASISSNGHEGDHVYYKCTKGKRKTKVKMAIRNQAINVSIGQVIGQKQRWFKVKIRGGGC